jgi:hypothetical protein
MNHVITSTKPDKFHSWLYNYEPMKTEAKAKKKKRKRIYKSKA